MSRFIASDRACVRISQSCRLVKNSSSSSLDESGCALLKRLSSSSRLKFAFRLRVCSSADRNSGRRTSSSIPGNHKNISPNTSTSSNLTGLSFFDSRPTVFSGLEFAEMDLGSWLEDSDDWSAISSDGKSGPERTRWGLLSKDCEMRRIILEPKRRSFSALGGTNNARKFKALTSKSHTRTGCVSRRVDDPINADAETGSASRAKTKKQLIKRMSNFGIVCLRA